MLSEQLLTYIKQNSQAGFGRADIEVALRAAGWSDADITAAFGAIERAQATPADPTAQPAQASAQESISKAQLSTNAEIARIQEELRKSTGNKPGPVTTEPGLVGLLITYNLASSKQGAKITIVFGVVFLLGLVYWIFLR